jgi:hypothetical protein
VIKVDTKESFKKVIFMELEPCMNLTAIDMKENGKTTCVMVKVSKYTTQNHKCIKVNLLIMKEMVEGNIHINQETSLMGYG